MDCLSATFTNVLTARLTPSWLACFFFPVQFQSDRYSVGSRCDSARFRTRKSLSFFSSPLLSKTNRLRNVGRARKRREKQKEFIDVTQIIADDYENGARWDEGQDWDLSRVFARWSVDCFLHSVGWSSRLTDLYTPMQYSGEESFSKS